MPRTPTRRTPAHERVVRQFRLACATIDKLEHEREIEQMLTAANNAAVAELRRDLALQREIKEQYAEQIRALREHANEGCLVPGDDWIALCDHLGLPAVPFDKSKQVSQVIDAVAGLVARIERVVAERNEFRERAETFRVELVETPLPMRIPCPRCGALHVDEGEFATRPHSTHTCQHCGECWKPCLRPTVGVRFLPGTRNET